MRLAESSREELEDFFQGSLTETGLRLEDVSFHAGWLAQRFVRIIRVNGITLGRHIFLTPQGRVEGQLSIPATLAVHEICHVIQYEQRGFVGFLISYLSGYFNGLRAVGKLDNASRRQAYLALADEVEAQAAESAFLRWRSNRRLEGNGTQPSAAVERNDADQLWSPLRTRPLR
ncbi:MAG: DUF4157 domain-containing protein [Pyrinomonadaceae bacterium]